MRRQAAGQNAFQRPKSILACNGCLSVDGLTWQFRIPADRNGSIITRCEASLGKRVERRAGRCPAHARGLSADRFRWRKQQEEIPLRPVSQFVQNLHTGYRRRYFAWQRFSITVGVGALACTRMNNSVKLSETLGCFSERLLHHRTV